MRLEGERVAGMDDLARIVQGHQVGDELEVQFLRNGNPWREAEEVA